MDQKKRHLLVEVAQQKRKKERILGREGGGKTVVFVIPFPVPIFVALCYHGNLKKKIHLQTDIY